MKKVQVLNLLRSLQRHSQMTPGRQDLEFLSKYQTFFVAGGGIGKCFGTKEFMIKVGRGVEKHRDPLLLVVLCCCFYSLDVYVLEFYTHFGGGAVVVGVGSKMGSVCPASFQHSTVEKQACVLSTLNGRKTNTTNGKKNP